MKTAIAVALTIAAQAIAPAADQDATVQLMVLREVSTRDARPGTIVKLRVHRPFVLPDGATIPVGAPAFGEVRSVDPSHIAFQRGALAISLSHVEIGGRRIALDSEMFVVRAKGGKGDDAAKLLLAPFYAPFAAQNSAKLRAGEIIRARLAAATGRVPASAAP